ncbi:hypothetical protein C9374_003732 [Naegleria lovaniensis]|uniref:Uncharacterized protein n=1 Tax=Naegleria lovaniensis TaxID=51637 RepID=A0AA88KQ76_NAELO|nr:uncharacterized protein C9374_003732 [Naegleria lovaniensis]KAG2393968.1 hypothetical protein C9374_003732 [Naegleria lovaniensis]
MSQFEVRLRNIPTLTQVNIPSEDELWEQVKSLNLLHPNDDLKEYINFMKTFGSGKLGRVHIYGLYPGSTFHQFDIRFHTKRIQNVFHRMLNPQQEEITNDDLEENSDLDPLDESNEIKQTLLRQYYDSQFSKMIVFGRDSIEETLYYAWHCEKPQEIYLLEVDEYENDVPPPRCVCREWNEFVERMCFGNFIDEEEYHSARFNRQETEISDSDNEEKQEREIERVFIPNMTLKIVTASDE